MGREISVDRGFGRVTTVEYNNRSWVTKVTRPDPDGAGALTSPVIQLGYNTRGDRTTVTDALGNVTTTAYDNEQRPTSVTYPDPDGAGPLTSPVTSTAYNAINWVTSTTDPRGGVTSYTFDNIGRVLTKTDPDPDGAGALAAPVTTTEYNAAGISKITDALNHAITYTRDSKGRVASMTDGLANVTNYTYDYYNNLLTQTDPDPDGAGPLARPVTQFTYDSVDRMTAKVDPLGGTTNYTYDLASNLTSLKDPVNNTTNFAYDGWNRMVLNTNSLSKSKSYTYDVAGNLTRTIDRNGREIQYVYDALDRQTDEKWQSGTTPPTLTVATTQDGGLLSEQQSVGWSVTAFGMSGTYTITQNGQTTSSIAWDASAATIQSALEALSTIGSGNVLVSVTSPNTYSRTISLTFRNSKAGIDMPQSTINTSGLMPVFGTVSNFSTTSVNGGNSPETQTITLANASGGTWRLAYNGEITAPLSPTITASQLKTTLDAFVGIDSVTVTGSSGAFTVTFGGTQASTNMSQIFGDAANATSGSTTRTIATAYNANDQITSVTDPSSTITYTLDNLGRATTIANTIAGLTPSVILNQSFDSASNRTELKATIGGTNDFKNSYQYDALQRLTDIVQQGQGGNAVTSKHVTQAFNALSQRTNISRYQSTGTTSNVSTTDFTFDTINRLTGIAHKQGTTNLNTYAYAFDPLSRITSVTSTAEGTSSYTYDQTSQVTGATHTSQSNESYGYDANGNRNTSGYTTGSNNQTTAGLGFTYTYDEEGNRLTRTETSTGKVQSYEWDYRNRLTAVKDRNTSGGAVVKQVDYEYDAINRLVKRVYDSDGAGAGASTSQFWVYDQGINAVLQFDGAAASNLSHRYLWSSKVDDLFSDEQVTSLGSGGNTQWGLVDHLGSLRDIADLNEGTGITTITNHRTISATGKIVSETNTAVDMLFAYTGKQSDDATGLQNNLNRWYDATIGQWLSEDPLSFNAGDENVRRYVKNFTTRKIDPSGLFDEDYNKRIIDAAKADLGDRVANDTMTNAEMQLRLFIIHAALYHRMGFSATERPESLYWRFDQAYFRLMNGHVATAVDRRVMGVQLSGGRVHRVMGSNTGCENAGRLMFLWGLGRMAETTSAGAITSFENRFLGEALQTTYGDFSNDLQEYLKKVEGIDLKTLTPGDRVRLDNPNKDKPGTIAGGQGSNVIYVGVLDGEHVFAHVTVGPNEWRLQTYTQLQNSVMRYSPPPHLDREKYVFTEHWKPIVPEWMPDTDK